MLSTLHTTSSYNTWGIAILHKLGPTCHYVVFTVNIHTSQFSDFKTSDRAGSGAEPVQRENLWRSDSSKCLSGSTEKTMLWFHISNSDHFIYGNKCISWCRTFSVDLVNLKLPLVEVCCYNSHYFFPTFSRHYGFVILCSELSIIYFCDSSEDSRFSSWMICKVQILVCVRLVIEQWGWKALVHGRALCQTSKETSQDPERLSQKVLDQEERLQLVPPGC